MKVAAAIVLASIFSGSGLQTRAAEVSHRNRIWIERSALSSELERGLREELPADRFAPAEESADIRISIEPEGSAIVLRIRSSASGQVLVERRFGVDHGQAPALRAALLVAVEALAESKEDAASAAPPETPPGLGPRLRISTAATRSEDQAPLPLHLIMGLGPEASWFSAPGTAELGARAVVELRLSDLSFGAALSVLGTPSWHLSVRQVGTGSETLTGSPLSIAPSARARYVFFESGPLDLSMGIDLGVAFERLDARPVVFVGNAPTHRSTDASPFARPEIAASVSISADLRLGVTAALQIRARRMTVALPDFFAAGSEPIQYALVAPLLGLGLSWSVF